MPCGLISYFEGDITKTESNALGFFYCEVTTPDYLLHPIIQLHHNNRTISPLGSFNGMFYSEEIYNAMKIGYKFNIKWGYTFTERKNLFTDYIEDMYKLRLTYDKTHPMNLTAKLLMNSLYGRFGMDDDFSNFKVIDKENYGDKLINVYKKYNIDIVNVDNLEFENDITKYLVESKKQR